MNVRGRHQCRPSAVGDVLGVDVAQSRVAGSGSGWRLGVVGRVVDGGLDLGRQARLDLVGQHAGVAELLAEARQRVAARVSASSSSAERYLVCWSSDECAGQPGHLGLDERRAVAGAGPRDRVARRRVAGQHVRAVDDHARDAVAGGPVGDVLDRAPAIAAGTLIA